MKGYVLLREYLRTCRRVKLRPTAEGFKKVEYLRFIGADVCPACGEEVTPDTYICTRDKNGLIVERYRCLACGCDYFFPQDVIH